MIPPHRDTRAGFWYRVRAVTQRSFPLAKTYDIAIVGGGATGLGAAVDAASQGRSVVLIEQQGNLSTIEDFLARRTRVLLRDAIADALGALLGWSPEIRAQQVATYQALAKEYSI
jgi:glycerol-3-phosphate dehydrogenase